MERYATNVGAEVERVVSAAEVDTTEALCRLSVAQRAFDRAVREMAERAARVPIPVAVAEAGVGRREWVECTEAGGRAVRPQLLQLFWLLVVALSSACFAAGFWFGRQAG